MAWGARNLISTQSATLGSAWNSSQVSTVQSSSSKPLMVVIGFSVDYTIHLGHMFDVARSQGLTTRREKFDYSIRKMGETVLAGAITTAGSTVFLLACQLTFFTAMGTLIILTVAFSLGYSLLFFMPLLRVAGPEGRVGDICHFLRGLKCACCRRA